MQQPNWWESKINKLNEDLSMSRWDIDCGGLENDTLHHIIEREKVLLYRHVLISLLNHLMLFLFTLTISFSCQLISNKIN
jgi:hypothetical protein